MLKFSTYTSRGRNITLENCIVFLSDNASENEITLEHHYTHAISIAANETNLSVQRADFTQTFPPVVFIHTPHLISRNISLLNCDLISTMNVYKLNLKLNNSQTKLFGKCNFLSFSNENQSFINSLDFFVEKIENDVEPGDISLTLEKEPSSQHSSYRHKEIYQDFLHFHLISSDISDKEKEYYLDLLINFKT